MKIRSVTIGDILIFLLIASSNGNQKTGQLHNNNASASNIYTKSPQNSDVAGSAYQLNKRIPERNERSHVAAKY